MSPPCPHTPALSAVWTTGLCQALSSSLLCLRERPCLPNPRKVWTLRHCLPHPPGSMPFAPIPLSPSFSLAPQLCSDPQNTTPALYIHPSRAGCGPGDRYSHELATRLRTNFKVALSECPQPGTALEGWEFPPGNFSNILPAVSSLSVVLLFSFLLQLLLLSVW